MSFNNLEETIDTGWVAPDGTFYGVKEGNHLVFLILDLCIFPEEVKGEGWIAIGQYGGFQWYQAVPSEKVGSGGLHNVECITEAQKETLYQIGLDPHDPKYKKQGIDFCDVFPDGYDFEVKPRHLLEEMLAWLDQQPPELRAKLDCTPKGP